jgi:hypothetical protein
MNEPEKRTIAIPRDELRAVWRNEERVDWEAYNRLRRRLILMTDEEYEAAA